MRTVLLDPAVLERFAAPGGDEPDTERDELNARRRARYWRGRFEALLEYLPPTEREMLVLYARKRCPQPQIAQLYDVTPQAVCQNLGRALERLQWLASWPGVGIDREAFEADLAGHLDRRTCVLVWSLLQSTNHSEAARAVGLPRQSARDRAQRALCTLRGQPRLQRYYLALRAVLERPNMLWRRPEATAPFSASEAEAARQ